MSVAIRALASALIDYAGLFPPAALHMETAVRSYSRYCSGEHAWMLGRFVVTAGRLMEFARAASSLWGDRVPDPPWRVSALAGSDVGPAVEAVREFQRTCEGAFVDALELKTDSLEQMAASREQIPPGVTPYFEIPWASDPRPCLASLAAIGARAKVRTGGITAQAFPPPRDLALFLGSCAALGVAFKATAGLHHLVRGAYPLTYEPESERCTMHGILNLLIATAFAHSGMAGQDVIAAILEEESAVAFRFDAAGVVWRDWRLAAEQVRSARLNLAVAIGSCSFEEPVNELRTAGLL